MTIKYRVTHHTSVLRTNQKQFQAVEEYHKNKNWGTERDPWYQHEPSKLGYYMAYVGFIDSDGIWTQTRLVGEEQFAVIEHNCATPETCDAVSICIAMDGNKQVFNEVQKKTLRKLYSGVIPLKTTPEYEGFELTHLKDKFHRNLQPNRTCPGKLITYEYLKEVLEENGFEERVKILKNEDLRNGREIELLQKQVSLYMRVVNALKAMINILLNKQQENG